MGSCITSLLKPYDITFPIISSWRTYKEGDVEQSLSQLDICNNTHTICILKKDTFSKVELEKQHQLDLSAYTKRSEFLIALNDKFKNSDVTFIGTTGNAAREMYSFMPDTQNFYMAGNMGGALSLGLSRTI